MKAYDLIRTREKAHHGANWTRLYNIIVPLRSGEFRMDTYAVKTRNKRTGELAIKKVAKYRSDRNRYYVRDILQNNYTNGYCVNWCNESFGHRHQAVWEDVDAYIGTWGYEDKDCRIIDMHGDWLNGLERTRYAKCGYKPNYEQSLFAYLEVWNECPQVEFLARAGLYRLITKAFARRLKSDKSLFAYFRNHIHEMTAYYGPATITYGHAHSVSLADAHRVIEFRGKRRACHNIPKTIPNEDLVNYLCKRDIPLDLYNNYCGFLSELGINIEAYGRMFPTRFAEDYTTLRDQCNAQRVIRKRAEERKKRIEQKRKLAHWKKICGYVETMDGSTIGDYTIAVPHTEADFITEGKAMHNCIGGYYNQMDSVILFIRKNGLPHMDIDIDALTFEVNEARYINNADATQEDYALANTIAQQIKTNYRKAA